MALLPSLLTRVRPEVVQQRRGATAARAAGFFSVTAAVGAAGALMKVDEGLGIAVAEAPALGSGAVGGCVVTTSDSGAVDGCGATTSGNGAIGAAGAMAAQPAKSGNSSKAK